MLDFSKIAVKQVSTASKVEECDTLKVAFTKDTVKITGIKLPAFVDFKGAKGKAGKKSTITKTFDNMKVFVKVYLWGEQSKSFEDFPVLKDVTFDGEKKIMNISGINFPIEQLFKTKEDSKKVTTNMKISKYHVVVDMVQSDKKVQDKEPAKNDTESSSLTIDDIDLD